MLRRRLGGLGQVLAELRTQEEGPPDVDELDTDLSRRWRLERGLLVAANLIVDVASHVTAAHFEVHPPTATFIADVERWLDEIEEEEQS